MRPSEIMVVARTVSTRAAPGKAKSHQAMRKKRCESLSICPRASAFSGWGTQRSDARLLWREVQEQRRVGAHNLVMMIEAKGGLKRGLDSATAADILAVLIEPGIYYQLVLRSGWSRPQFEVWIAQTMQTQLL